MRKPTLDLADEHACLDESFMRFYLSLLEGGLVEVVLSLFRSLPSWGIRFGIPFCIGNATPISSEISSFVALLYLMYKTRSKLIFWVLSREHKDVLGGSGCGD